MSVLFIAVALGWFALAVTVIMIFELFWPSGRGWHPIRAISGALRRRKRMVRHAEVLRIIAALAYFLGVPARDAVPGVIRSAIRSPARRAPFPVDDGC